MRRGEVWWADVPEAGRHPMLLLSRDDAYSYRSMVLVAPITTRIRGIVAEVALGQDEGLPRASVANLDAIRLLATHRLLDRVGALSATRMLEVEDAIHYALGLSY